MVLVVVNETHTNFAVTIELVNVSKSPGLWCIVIEVHEAANSFREVVHEAD